MTDIKTPLSAVGMLGRLIVDSEGTHIASADSAKTADHIVKCVNMHDELVEAFSSLFNWLMKFNGEEEHKENTDEEDEADFKMLMRCQETLKKAGRHD